jgi:NTP pyrophosphatase (non-canonical NTP hydrolase)
MLDMITMKSMVIRKIGVDMDKVEQEILCITQEECAEVTQAISKVFRFGYDSVHNGVSNSAHLSEEMGDLLCMIELMIRYKLVDANAVEYARRAKMEKLAKWSSIK